MNNQKAWNSQWDVQKAQWFENPAFVKEAVDAFEGLAPLQEPVLDVGCGRGVFTKEIGTRAGGDIIGCDLAEDSLHAIPVPACAADACKLPFPDASFGSVTAVLLIEHLPDPSEFIAESRRILKPGGHLYLLYPNLFSMVAPALFLYRNVLNKRDIPIHNPMSRGQVEKMMISAGIEPVGSSNISIADYRKGVERLMGMTARLCLPASMGEEVILVGKKNM